MRQFARRALVASLASLLMIGGLSVTSTPAAAAPAFTVLVFSKTAGFRHSSIGPGITAIQQLGAANNFAVDATEDATRFTDAGLAPYAAVIWLSTTGDVLNASQQAAFERYVAAGKGYAGIHAASDTEYDWAWYGGLVGAYFANHPAEQNATVVREDAAHPSTSVIPERWTRFDEWYSYRTNPRSAGVRVLAKLDESTYSGGTMGADHPITWCQNYQGGRSWYTGMGHTDASYSDATFRNHLLGGIRTAAGALAADCGPPAPAGTFNQVTLAKGVASVGEPMGLTVLPDRSVLHTSRDGVIRLTTATGSTKVAATIPVYTHDEEGLQSIKVDPNFVTNRWVYIYYSPPLNTPAGDAPETGTAATFAPYNGLNRIGRFTVRADGTFDMASQVTVLDVPTTRGLCCHVGGDIDFDAQGNLYLATGDDSNPFSSDGYTPIDERTDRNPAFDAQRTAANSNDLRGKVLRIKPSAGGGYTVPAGNMFAPGTASTKPEIYAMGFRNPFRMSVDRATGVVYLGDFGPDAATSSVRGPSAVVEFARVDKPGNYGWPYCVGANEAYGDHNFATGVTGAKYNCAAPVNDSPNNTGLRNLPPAITAWLPYRGNSVPEFGDGGLSPQGGPVYRFSAANPSATKFPASYDGKFFAGEFGRRWIKTVAVNPDGSRGAIAPFPFNGTQVMDMEFGPDGALYVLDYGTSFFGGSPESAVYRMDFVAGGDRSPIAAATGTPTSGRTPLAVAFSSAGSNDPDGTPLTYAWDFDGNGSTDSTAPNPSFTYTVNGNFAAKLIVSSNGKASNPATVPVTVGNTAPVVTFDAPLDGTVFNFGDAVPWRVTVTDAEEATDCARVKVSFVLGHDAHGHPLTPQSGCSGTIQTVADGEHGAEANVFGVLVAEYTDGGGLTTTKQHVLQPGTRQAEHFSTSQGVELTSSAAAAGGRAVGFIENGDWISFTPYNLTGVTGFKVRAASGGIGGTVELHAGSATGPLVASVTVPVTSSWTDFREFIGTMSGTSTTSGPLFLVFKGTGTGSLFDVDHFTFTRTGTPPAGNVALGKRVTTSSVQDATLDGAKAVDGLANTRWSSASADPQWIEVDLGARYNITGVKLNWETAFGKAYRVETSNGGGDAWRGLFSTTTGDGGIDDLAVSGGGRLVRVTGTARGTGWGYSLWELEVRGTEIPETIDVEFSRGKPVLTSSDENAGLAGPNAVDGNPATRWASAFADPQWIRVDLGTTQTINRVQLNWEGAYGKAYQVQTSADGLTGWTTIFSTTTGDGGIDNLTGLTGSGRYVRVNGTVRGTGWGYSLWELAVFGPVPRP